MALPEKIGSFLNNFINKLIPEEKRTPAAMRIVYIGSAGVLVLLIFIIILAASGSGKKRPAQPDYLNMKVEIPPAEVFLPDEPDFIPGVTLDRDRRETWTAADAEPYWQDPLKKGEEEWREKIETAIDNYMERVP